MKKYFFLVLILVSGLNYGQNKDEAKKDIKVGLVLSGGGAKGYAHVGVLKVLEKAGVRIDYIAGTSMGAIIGGLYASGYSARELDSILMVHDFSELTNDEVPREAYSFYQKKNKGKYAVSLPINNWKISLPKSISKGQNILNLLTQLTEHQHQVEDFSKLPIPFFCIATNLETGEEVVLDKGFLPEAIRASSSFPSVYSPVEIEDKILVDGGLVNNYPIEKLKEKGVDFIIGVNVQGKLNQREALTSAPAILMQIAGYQLYKGMEEKKKITDLYLEPDVGEYGEFSFDAAEDIIQAGESIARANIKAIEEIVVQQKASDNLRLKRVKIKRLSEKITISNIYISGNENYTDNYCLDKLKINVGDVVSQEEFMQGIEGLSATGNFESIQYRLIKENQGTKVEIKIIENEITTFVKLGVHYDDLYKTGILVNLTMKHPLFKNDFLSSDFVVGDNLRYNVDYFVDNGSHLSYGINGYFNTFPLNLLLDETPLDSLDTSLRVPSKYTDMSSQIYVQTTFWNKIAFRVGAEYKELKLSTEAIIDGVSEKIFFENSGYGNIFGKLTFDSYSSDYFPKKGLYFEANYKAYLLAFNSTNNFESFSQLYGNLGYATTFYNKFTLHISGAAGATIGSNGTGIHDYILGGNNENFINTFVKFYGYDVADLTASAFIKSDITVRYEIFKNNFVSFTSNFAEIEDDLWENIDFFQDVKTGFALGYGLKTIIGPVQVKYSWRTNRSQNFWYFNFGYWF